jgi:hypothetical protein
MASIKLSTILTAIQGEAKIEVLHPEDTGLPMTVCLLVRDNSQYGPRIEVSRERGPQLALSEMVSVTISDNPKIVGGGWLPGQDLKLVRAWVLLNGDALLRYWSHELSQADMMAALRPFGKPRGSR